jgi:hypothetical protein
MKEKRTIYKYPISKIGYTTIQMPLGAEILSMQLQGNHPHIWALVNSSNPKVDRQFIVYDTGTVIQTDVHGDVTFIGTFQIYDEDGFRGVGHVFEIEKS